MKRFSILPLILVALCCCPVSAQDIILLNQDGEKVGVAKDVEGEKIVGDQAKKPAADGEAKKGSATLENGIITIVGPDGKVEQFELSDAKSFTVTRSSKTVVDEEGNRKRESVNKAILIGPDGVRREINLGDGSNNGSATKAKKEKTWMIGASCEPVTPVLRAQLRLDETMGLVVTRVLRGGNAADAGLQVNDILMYADQKPVGNRKQLSEVVNAAGSAGTDIALMFLRGGEEMSIKVKPAEREDVDEIGDIGVMKLQGMGLRGFGDNMDFEFKQFGPGIIIGRGGFGEDGGFEERHRKMIEEQQKRMEQFEKRMEDMRRRMNGGR